MLKRNQNISFEKKITPRKATQFHEFSDFKLE